MSPSPKQSRVDFSRADEKRSGDKRTLIQDEGRKSDEINADVPMYAVESNDDDEMSAKMSNYDEKMYEGGEPTIVINQTDEQPDTDRMHVQ